MWSRGWVMGQGSSAQQVGQAISEWACQVIAWRQPLQQQRQQGRQGGGWGAVAAVAPMAAPVALAWWAVAHGVQLSWREARRWVVNCTCSSPTVAGFGTWS